MHWHDELREGHLGHFTKKTKIILDQYVFLSSQYNTSIKKVSTY